MPFNIFTRHFALYCDLFEQEETIVLETRRNSEFFFVFCFVFVFYLSQRRVVGKGNVDGGMRGGNSGNSPPSPAQTVTQINYPVCSPLSSTSELLMRLNCKSDGTYILEDWKAAKKLLVNASQLAQQYFSPQIFGPKISSTLTLQMPCEVFPIIVTRSRGFKKGHEVVNFIQFFLAKKNAKFAISL